MEVLTSNGHSAVEEVDKVDLSETGIACDFESAALKSSLSPYNASNVPDSRVDTMKVYTKRKALDVGSGASRSPSKKPNVGALSDDRNAELDPPSVSPFLANVAEEMIIDTPSFVAGERESDTQPDLSCSKQLPGAVASCTPFLKCSLEASDGVSSEASKPCETARGSHDAHRLDITGSCIDCNTGTAKREGEPKLEDVEKSRDSGECFADVLPVQRSAGDQFAVLESSVNKVHALDVIPAAEKTSAKPDTKHSRDVCGSYTVHASGVIEAEGVCQSETTDEDVIDSGSGITEVDDVHAKKADAANIPEENLAKDSVQAPGSKGAEGPDGTEDKDGDKTKIDKDVNMDRLAEDEHSTEPFSETLDEAPEHVEGTSGLHSGTIDSEELSNGQASTMHLNLEAPRESSSGMGEDSSDMQESEVATPSAVTPAQSQSSDLKLPVKSEGPDETPLKEAPASAKQLLASGLLEGHRVRYLGRGVEVMLTGIVQDGGVLCDCRECKGSQIVTVSAFEKHAGSTARHPSDFIFLENGKCLKDILEVGWNADKHELDTLGMLKAAIGEVGSDNMEGKSCCKCGLREGELISCSRPRCLAVCHTGCCGVSQLDWLCPKCEKVDKKPRSSLDTKPRSSLDTKPRLSPDTKPRSSLDTKPRLSRDTWSRSSLDSKSKGTEGRAALTREGSVREKELVKPPTLSRELSGPNLHKALFLPGGLPDDCKLGYYVKGQQVLAGVKKGVGICCSCCQQVISCSLFEQHAGWGSRRNPYSSIYLADGRSLHEAAQSLVITQQSVKQEGGAPTKIENVDYCNECGDGGDLLPCNGCPSAYHRDCLGSGNVPPGDFFCPDCQQQRFGGTKDRRRAMVKKRAKGNSKTLLAKDRVTGRCTRLLQVVEAVEIGACVFCNSGDFAKSGFGPMTTLLCDQCEREYHVGCLKEHGLADLKELPEGEWFCGEDCKHIHSILRMLVANGPEALGDSIISHVLESKSEQGRLGEEAEPGSSPGFEWQLLHGRGGDPGNGKTLAEAVQIFSVACPITEGSLSRDLLHMLHYQECFDPIVDGISGGDLIPLMVYRRSIRDQDFGGIYCVVLKQNDKVVSTALIRIFGRQLAELPLLATSLSHQGQGHCRALLLSIERLLGVLRVDRLALPAAAGAEDIWLNKFGFKHMPDPQVKQFQTDVNMMVFTGSSMLEKEIAPVEFSQF